MAFRFKRKESVPDGVRRIARERLQSALDCLERPGNPLAAVHQVRKETKKLRALLRLTRRAFTRKSYHAECDAIRSVAKQLASARDARVKLQTLDDLIGKNRNAALEFKSAKAALTAEFKNEATAFRDRGAHHQAKEALHKILARAVKWKLTGGDWQILECGLTQSYQDGCKALAAVRRKPSDHCFHECRKDLKELWYEITLLSSIWPGPMSSLSAELKTIGEDLGRQHDLAVLADWVKKQDPSVGGKPLLRLIRSQQKGLEKRVIPTVQRLYAESPSAFCRRVATYWRAWRRR